MGSVRARHLPTVLLASARMVIPPDPGTHPDTPTRTPRPKGAVLKPRFVINLDDQTAERLRRYAYRTKRSKNEIVRDALIAHLQEHA